MHVEGCTCGRWPGWSSGPLGFCKVDALEGKVDALGAKVDALEGKVDSVLDLLRGRNGG